MQLQENNATTVRDAFFNAIYRYTFEGADICITSADLGAPSLDKFRRDFGNRFINVGIAEQNLVAVAAGLAMGGKTAVAYGLNPFPVTRAFDQVRNLMANLKVPMTLAALNAGTCSAESGYTHMPVENMSIMRTLRNIKTVNPSDVTISEKVAELTVKRECPVYVQFDKYIRGRVYEPETIDLEKGFITTGDGPITVVAYGICAKWIRDNLAVFREQGYDLKLIDGFCLPLDKSSFVEELQQAEAIVSMEDGVVYGGIGSLVMEILSDYDMQKKVKRIGLRFDEGYSSIYRNREMIFDDEGMTLASVMRKMEVCLA